VYLLPGDLLVSYMLLKGPCFPPVHVAYGLPVPDYPDEDNMFPRYPGLQVFFFI